MTISSTSYLPLATLAGSTTLVITYELEFVLETTYALLEQA